MKWGSRRLQTSFLSSHWRVSTPRAERGQKTPTRGGGLRNGAYGAHTSVPWTGLSKAAALCSSWSSRGHWKAPFAPCHRGCGPGWDADATAWKSRGKDRQPSCTKPVASAGIYIPISLIKRSRQSAGKGLLGALRDKPTFKLRSLCFKSCPFPFISFVGFCWFWTILFVCFIGWCVIVSFHHEAGK